MFPIRTCVNFEHYIKADRPCLNYHIKSCVGPCYSRSGVTAEAHRALAERFGILLAGKDEEIRHLLEDDMAHATGERRYEDAALARDRLAMLDRLGASQKVLGPRAYDTDALGLARQGDRAVLAVLHVREGRVIGNESGSCAASPGCPRRACCTRRSCSATCARRRGRRRCGCRSPRATRPCSPRR